MGSGAQGVLAGQIGHRGDGPNGPNPGVEKALSSWAGGKSGCSRLSAFFEIFFLVGSAGPVELLNAEAENSANSSLA